ncbi:MAG: helix-turn-helix transcriptional regulator [Kiritimatiellia bacterium]
MKITYSKQPNPLAKAVAKAVGSVEGEIEYRTMFVLDQLLHQMKQQGISKAELAKRMNVATSRVTDLLCGDGNLTVDMLVRAGHALDVDLVQIFVPRGQKGRWVKDE